MNYTITKDNFIKQIKIWQKNYNIFTCQKNENDFFWDKINLNNPNILPLVSLIPPTKKFFLPNNEELFKFVFNKIITRKNIRPTILLGLPDTDLKAISLLDKVLAPDHYYQTNRQQFIIIGFGPQISDEKCDIFIQNINNDYQITINTDKAHKIITKNLYKKISDNYINKTKNIDSLFVNQEKLVKAVKASVNDKIWDELAKICLGCGICSYVCPLCYCFSIEDKIDLDNKICSKSCQLCSGTRIRKWDSCMLPHFSQVAGPRLRGSDSRSGHNFRPKLRNRIYNWYHHKFVRFPMEYGKVGCVNCGRCIKYCPAKINYRQVLEKILKKYQ